MTLKITTILMTTMTTHAQSTTKMTMLTSDEGTRTLTVVGDVKPKQKQLKSSATVKENKTTDYFDTNCEKVLLPNTETKTLTMTTILLQLNSHAAPKQFLSA